MAALGGLLLAACGHGSGDPGGMVLRELKPVATAIPPRASDVRARFNDPTWQSKCPDNPYERSGWSQVAVSATFDADNPETDVIASIDADLVHLGWSRNDTAVTAGQGPVAHWTRSVGGGRRADAFAYPVPAGSDHWWLTASWDPPGFALPGC